MKKHAFSLSAREAAARSRRERREERDRARVNGVRGDRPEVFVSRDPDDPRSFLFELRRFGGVVLYRSAHSWPDPADARDAGLRVLAEALPDADPEA